MRLTCDEMAGRRFAAQHQRHLNYGARAGNIQKLGAGLSSDPIPRGAAGGNAGLAAYDKGPARPARKIGNLHTARASAPIPAMVPAKGIDGTRASRPTWCLMARSWAAVSKSRFVAGDAFALGEH